MILEGGPPVQARPLYPEPGLPLYVITPGTPSPYIPPAIGTPPGAGSNDDPATLSADPMVTLLSTRWGGELVEAVQSIGINPAAMAATCQVESNCQNVPNSAGAAGPFQMFPAAFQEGIARALTANPALADRIVPGPDGRHDAFTNGVAAAGYQLIQTERLERAGITNPTVMDLRGSYQMGPAHGVRLAQAEQHRTMGEVMPGAPDNFFSGNGITRDTTVGQWRAGLQRRVGNASRQTVRI